MSDNSGYYSLIQFGARPSSFEYINVGVMVGLKSPAQWRLRISHDPHRVKKLFEDQNGHDFRLKAESFQHRLEHEIAVDPSLDHLAGFAQSRVNQFRMLPFKPMFVFDLDADLQRMFDDLVGHDRPRRRLSPQQRLRELFRVQGVQDMVDANPEPVHLPGMSQAIRADYGYQNGHYNLIEAVSFKAKQDLNALRRVSGDAHLLKQHSDKRLVVVADLPDHASDLLSVIERSLGEAEARVYPMGAIVPLVDDIRHHARLHDPSRLIQ